MLARSTAAAAAAAQTPPPPRHAPPDRDSAPRVGTGRLAPRGVGWQRRFWASGAAVARGIGRPGSGVQSQRLRALGCR